MRALFVMTNLKSGGISSALVNLLKEISRSKDDINIDLLLFDNVGNNIDELPNTVKVLTANDLARITTQSLDDIKKESKFLWIVRVVLTVWTKVFGDTVPYWLICKTNRKYSDYDFAFSCTQSAPTKELYGCCNEFVLRNTSAKCKIAFIHCDYKKYGLNDKHNKKIYMQFDKIITVSESSKDLFLECVPELKERTYSVYNCVDYDRVKQLANHKGNMRLKYHDEVLNFISIARLGNEKGHIRLARVLKRLILEGMSFHWHVVGDGDARVKADLENFIIENKMESYVTLYGNQSNPYDLLKNSDLLLLMSYHECAPMVFNEALTLGVPILTTNTLSAKEMVENNGYGIVCENSDEGLYNAIKKVILNRNIVCNIKEHIIANYEASNDEVMRQFWRILNE